MEFQLIVMYIRFSFSRRVAEKIKNRTHMLLRFKASICVDRFVNEWPGDLSMSSNEIFHTLESSQSNSGSQHHMKQTILAYCATDPIRIPRNVQARIRGGRMRLASLPPCVNASVL